MKLWFPTVILALWFVAIVSMAAMSTPDVKVREDVPVLSGFANLVVENTGLAAWDKNKSNRDTQELWSININKVIAFTESEDSTKKYPRTNLYMSEFGSPLTVLGDPATIADRLENSYISEGGFIGNSPFPRFGDTPKEKDKPKDKGHPDKKKKTTKDK